ncbi:PBSX family phage terminase large subunit [Streptomyces gilvifuscus]|uniref:PBSX family phage terminase large subunit n=1 Tax=Streptomyces gilvifuscus TaxID=1550617 RepID=A0ABT5FLH9_9ACTN|nr:PBSX family phage terminase large subunit [Streptomyces gilvifuscus]MDC2953377.1 PBSX family phage terminase large subunit [Streptomyces gilvifuscus]
MPTSTARSTQFLLERFSPKQIRSIAAANRRINLWEGAVSSGKTIASAWAWMVFVPQASTTGELVMIGKTKDSLYRNVLQPMMNPEIFGELAAQVEYTPGAVTCRIFGRLVHVIGANDIKSENKIRGMTCAGAYVDEATLLPEPFWDMLLTRMRAPGARIYASTNPDSPAHWLKAQFIDNPIRRAAMKVFSFVLDDNVHLDHEYVEHTKASFSGLFYKRFILGEWCVAEGAIYSMFDEPRHVVDIVPTIERWIALGVDYGTANPLHAILVGLGIDGRLYVTSEWRYDGRASMHQLTDAEYSEQIRGWLSTLRPPGALTTGVQPQYVVVDPSAASFIQQLHRDRLTPYPADNSVLDGIRTVSSLLATGRLLVHRSCTELIKEIQGYVWDPKAALLGEDKPLKLNDHGVDALRYALQTTESLWRYRIEEVA